MVVPRPLLGFWWLGLVAVVLVLVGVLLVLVVPVTRKIGHLRRQRLP